VGYAQIVPDSRNQVENALCSSDPRNTIMETDPFALESIVLRQSAADF
jgi:hypothetical protein